MLFWVTLGKPLLLSPCHCPRYKVRDWIVVSRFASGMRIPRGQGEGELFLKNSYFGGMGGRHVGFARQAADSDTNPGVGDP